MTRLPSGFRYKVTSLHVGVQDFDHGDPRPYVEVFDCRGNRCLRLDLTKNINRFEEPDDIDFSDDDLETVIEWLSEKISKLRSDIELHRIVKLSDTLVYDFDTHRLYNAYGYKIDKNHKIEGNPVRLTRQHWAVFERLIESAGTTVPDDELYPLLYESKVLSEEDKDKYASATKLANLVSTIRHYHPDVLNKFLRRMPGAGFLYCGPKAEWVVGDIRLYLPANTKTELVAKTYSSPSTYHIDKKCLAKQCSGDCFVPRPSVRDRLFKLFECLSDDNRIVFLSGFGGIGKSEIARYFANEAVQTKQFKSAIPLSYSPESNAFDTAVRSSVDFIKEYVSDEDEKHRIKKHLLSHAGADTLLIVDNYDYLDLAFLDQVHQSTAKARILITTRLGPQSEIRNYGSVLPLGDDQDQFEFARQVFLKYAREGNNELDRETSECIDAVIRAIDAHTMLAALLGLHVFNTRFDWMNREAFPDYIKDFSSELSKALHGGFASGGHSLTKDGVTIRSDSAYGMLKILFSSILQRPFSEPERQVLGALVLLENRSDKNAAFIGSLIAPNLPEYSRSILEAVRSLINSGIVLLDDDYKLDLHPLMQQLLTDPSIVSDGHTIAEICDSFLLHLYKNYMCQPNTISTKRIRFRYMAQFLHLHKTVFNEQIHWDNIGVPDYGWVIWHNLNASSQIREVNGIRGNCKINPARLVSAVYLNHLGAVSKETIIEILSRTLCTNEKLNWDTVIPTQSPSPYGLFKVYDQFGVSLFLHDFLTGADLCISDGNGQLRRLYVQTSFLNAEPDSVTPYTNAVLSRLYWNTTSENAGGFTLDLGFDIKFISKGRSDVLIPITEIEQRADYEFPAMLKQILWGRSIKYIGFAAFEKTAPRSIELPPCVKTVESRAFFCTQSFFFPDHLSFVISSYDTPLHVGNEFVIDEDCHCIFTPKFLSRYCKADNVRDTYNRTDLEVEKQFIERRLMSLRIAMPFHSDCMISTYNAKS